MSVESAKAYITRMRNDEPFRKMINAVEDDEKNWAVIKEHGYEFTVEEFKSATEEIYKEYGIDPM